jgi:superkiller protein 3
VQENTLFVLFISLSLITTPQLPAAQNIDQLYQQGITAQNDSNYSQAEAIWRQVLQQIPKDATAYFYLSKALAFQNKQQEAVTAYQQPIQLNPNDVRAYENLGLALYKQKKLDETLAVLRKAISLDPNNANNDKDVGNVLRNSKNLMP